MLSVAASGRTGRGSGRAKASWFWKCAEEFQGTARGGVAEAGALGGEGQFAAEQTSKGHCKDWGFALSGTGSQGSVSSREVT